MAEIRSPLKGSSAGRDSRRRRSERRMRGVGISAACSACAVRISTMSWNVKRYSLRGPRAGVTKPSRTRPAMTRCEIPSICWSWRSV
jgi:hypothetical protein